MMARMKCKMILPTLLILSGLALAQTPDTALLAEINKIRAIDNHTHVPKIVAAGEKDDEYDALPCDERIEPADNPTFGRPENPWIVKAWQSLYGYKYNDAKPEHVKELLEAKQRVMREQGDNYPTWLLDRIGTEYMLANRIAMGRGLNAPRFRWVAFDDALMLPLNSQAVADSPDRKFFYQREKMLLDRYMKEAGVASLPATLDEFVARVIAPVLEQQKKSGAVAIKFEAAYLRSLNFGDPQEEEARRIYARGVAGGSGNETPSKTDYLKLQDVLFRAIAREAGRQGLAVHIHTGSGCGSYFAISGSNPALLDSVLNDASLRMTTFVLVHGGSGPFTKVAAFQMSKPNVYVDISEQVWILPTRAVAAVLRDWLEWYPEKVLFGTDLFPGTPEVNWEEIGWVASRNGRDALAVALTGMMNDGEISRARALEIARMVLRGNAMRIYGIDK